jgi:hypothetical protein
MNELVQNSCNNGHLEIIKILFNSPFEFTFNRPHEIQCFFTNAIKAGQIEIAKYLIDTPSVKIGSNFTTPYFGAIAAAEYGHLDILKYILEPSKNYLINSINPEAQIVEAACRKDNVPILQYLMTLPNYNLQKNLEKGFESALHESNLNNLRYMIFDLNIEKNQNINRYLKKYKNDEVEKMFIIRDLNNSLQSELISSQNKNKTMKV